MIPFVRPLKGFLFLRIYPILRECLDVFGGLYHMVDGQGAREEEQYGFAYRHNLDEGGMSMCLEERQLFWEM
jgi:hypothetical protein